MAIESDILNEVATLLGNIATPTYNTDPAFVLKRPIYPASIDGQDEVLGLYVTYGDNGQAVDRFTDTPRLGRINEMLPIEVTAVLKEQGASDLTVIAAEIHEDIKRAIGDNIRQNVSGVNRAVIRGASSIRRLLGTENEVLIFPIEVWHDWEQRDIAQVAPTGQIIPQNVSISISGTDATITWDIGTEDGVDVYRNGIEVESLNVAGTYTDSSWLIDNTYRLSAVYGAVDKFTETFAYPYYPANEPEVRYYGQAWGGSNIAPELLIEARIRREYEQLRTAGSSLEQVNYTILGSLSDGDLITSRMPLVHIMPISTTFTYANMAEDENLVTFRATVYADADQADTDPHLQRMYVNEILDGIRTANSDNHAWNGTANAFDTPTQRVQWAGDAQEVGFILAFTGFVEFTVRFRQT